MINDMEKGKGQRSSIITFHRRLKGSTHPCTFKSRECIFKQVLNCKTHYNKILQKMKDKNRYEVKNPTQTKLVGERSPEGHQWPAGQCSQGTVGLP